MGRDFAKKGRRKPKSSDGYRHWLWLISGFCIGTLLTALCFFKLFIEPQNVAPKLQGNQVSEAVEEKPTAPTVQFDFYNLLPKLEVPLPNNEKSQQLPPKVTATPEAESLETTADTITHHQRYRLQLGSFRDFADADRLKAQLALLGIELEVEAVTLAEGDTWYRVRTMPFPDRKSAESIKDKLASQSIESLLLEEK